MFSNSPISAISRCEVVVRKMSFIINMIDELAEIEDDDLMGVFKNLYGPTVQLSLLFPSWKREHLLFTFGLIGFYCVTLVLHCLIFTVSVVKLTEDFETACLMFHYWLIVVMILTAMLLLNMERVSMAEVHRNLAHDVGKYKGGRIYSEEKPMRFENEKKRELIRFLILPGMVVVIAGAVLMVPYITKFNDPPYYNSQGVNMNLPLATYYPIPTDRGLIHGIVVLGQLLAAFALAFVIVILEILLFRVSQAIIFEYKILQYALQTLFTRAKRHFSETHPEHGGRLSHKNPDYQKCIGEGIKDCIKHHHKIQELLSGYQTVVKWPAALAFGIGTSIIGLGLYNFMMAKENGDVEFMITFGLLVVVETLNMYILSVLGENITTESVETRTELYFIEWPKLDITNRRLMLNFQVGINNPVIVKAGGLVDICMDTFSSIMNSSYSFLNIINAN